MALFAVIPIQNPVAIGAVVKTIYPNDHLQVDGIWLVGDRVSASEVSDKLGISSGAHGGAIVLGVSNYWGWTQDQTWQWMAARFK